MIDSLSRALAGRYDVDREIGRGGMATVYLARDIKHERNVAVKVLNPELGAVLGIDRFLAEIKVTANLQHPNLLPLFDSGEAAGLLYYVMPFVDGESLRAKLDREKQLPVDEAVRISTAIANALEYAHAHGVIHRDLKPENILLQAGQPVVADFGIALAVSKAGGARVTQTGLSLGTPQYMSPEQATGDRDIDARSDIYALGAITYEMLAGEPPHTGSTSQAVIARLITERPRALRDVRPSTPEHVEAAVDRALEKLPADRWSSAAEFRDALAGRIPTGGSRSRAARVALSRRTQAAMWAVALLPALALAALLINRLRSAPPAAPQFRFSVPAGDRGAGRLQNDGVGGHNHHGDFAVSPDGMSIVFSAVDTLAARSLWLRRLDSLVARRIPETIGGDLPFWSPDGKSIGFFAGTKLKRVDLAGSVPTVLCDAGDSPAGAAWLASDEIVFGRGNSGLFGVSARGGVPKSVTLLDTSRSELAHAFPQALPDGRHFLYLGMGFRAGASRVGIFVASLDGGVPKLLDVGTGIFAQPNHFLSFRGTDIVAVEFNPKTFETRGDPVPVVRGDAVQDFSVSSNGVLVYRIATPSGTSLDVLDRSGKVVRELGPFSDAEYNDYYAPRISPDGRLVAAEHHLAGGTQDLYAYELSSGTTIRETFDPKNHSAFVAWSPDGRQLAYASTKSGGGDVYVKSVDAPGDHLLVPTSPSATFPSDWSSDGKWLLFDRNSAATQSDVWLMPMTGGAPRPLIASPANEMQATFSPDGRWVAYASDEENGRFEVFVRPFPANGQQWKISNGGGEGPRWRRDGKEIFYHTPVERGNGITAVPIDAGATVRAGPPVELFKQPIRFLSGFLRSGVEYDVSADGKTFVAVLTHERQRDGRPTLEVVVNWPSALKVK